VLKLNELPWRDGGGRTTRIGFVNPHRQRCMGTLGIQGTDHLQHVYKVECLWCGYVYGANGSDLHLRRCPQCSDGAKGLPYWRSEVRRSS
jgi:hypothetical protein